MYIALDLDEVGRKIVDICIDPEINYPSKLFNHAVGCEPIVYKRLIFKCIQVLGLEGLHDNDLPRTPLELEHALTITNQWLNQGYAIYWEKNGGKRPANETPFGYYLEEFEKERNKDPQQAIKIHPAYYLIALECLSDYKSFCLASFREAEEFEQVVTDSTPYRQSINALGMLLNAQLCIELGSASLERAFGNVRVADVSNQLSELEKKQQHAQRGLSDTNGAKAWLQDKAKQIAILEWQGDIEEKMRTGQMADHIIAKLPMLVDDDQCVLPDQKTLFKKNIPKIATMKKWIGPVAPEYAKKPGR